MRETPVVSGSILATDIVGGSSSSAGGIPATADGVPEVKYDTDTLGRKYPLDSLGNRVRTSMRPDWCIPDG